MVFNQTVNYSSETDELSQIFMALADPTRRDILAMLRQNDATVNELAEPFAMSLPAISKHLKVLEQAGLISRTKQAQYRPRRLETVACNSWMSGCRDTPICGRRICRRLKAPENIQSF